MGRYVVHRLVQIIPVFFGTTFIIYAAVFALRGDPIRALFGPRAPAPGVISELRERYNLDDPLLIQYGKYIGNLLQGDLGTNFRGRPVLDIVSGAYPVTVKLAVTAFAIEVVLGLAAGVLCGVRGGSYLDSLVLVCTSLIISVPVFIVAYAAQLMLGAELGLFPISFSTRDGWPRSYLLPALVLASLSLATLARLTRTSLLETLRADFIRTAVAKGVPRHQIVTRHALRNSLLPVVTLLGVDLGGLMGGAVVTEGVFNVPGIGRAVYLGIINHEGTVVVGISTLFVLVFLFANLFVDLLYGLLDPRVRFD